MSSSIANPTTNEHTASMQAALDRHFHISPEQIAQFQADGHILLRDVLSTELLEAYGPRIAAAVERRAATAADIPLAERTVYDQAFLQVTNLWETDEELIPFLFNQCLARIAAELMGVSGVRMYHDQALFKEPGGGYTPWHTDQRYWPVSNSNNITAWIPLCDIPMEKGPLEFCTASQHITENRELAISEESEAKINKMLKLSDLKKSVQPFNLGDVSFHYGATFHRAGPNNTDQMRSVMTVIYVDKDMRMDICERNQGDAKRWCPGCKDGELMASPLNPILWQR